MQGNTQLADAESIELEQATRDGAETDVDVGRWTNYGKDRLYINDGIPKADKYSLHVDLKAGEVVSDNGSAHSGHVEVDDDTATVTIISHVGLDDTEYTLTLDLN